MIRHGGATSNRGGAAGEVRRAIYAHPPPLRFLGAAYGSYSAGSMAAEMLRIAFRNFARISPDRTGDIKTSAAQVTVSHSCFPGRS